MATRQSHPDPGKPSPEQIQATAKIAILRAFQGNAHIHREIIKRGKDEWLMQCERGFQGRGLSVVDFSDIYYQLVESCPPWIHEMPDGTILDEQGFIVIPDADDLVAAEEVLRAARCADDLMAQLRASSRAATR